MDSENSNYDDQILLEKRKVLFDFAKARIEEQLDRANAIGQKVPYYLTALSFITGVFGLLVKEIWIDTLPDSVGWSLISLFAGIVLLLSIIFAVYQSLCVMRLQKFKRLHIDEGVVDFFEGNELKNIYLGYAKIFCDDYKYNEENIVYMAKKLQYVERAIIFIISQVIIILAIVAIANRWMA